MKYLILGVLLPLIASAQVFVEDQTPSSSDILKKSHPIISIHFTRGQPVRIFVVGREEAKLDLSNMQLTVRAIKPYQGQVLVAHRKENYFVVSDPRAFQKATEIEVTTQVKDQTEVRHFKLKEKTP